MPLFQRLFEPDIQNLVSKKDVEGLLQAMAHKFRLEIRLAALKGLEGLFWSVKLADQQKILSWLKVFTKLEKDASLRKAATDFFDRVKKPAMKEWERLHPNATPAAIPEFVPPAATPSPSLPSSPAASRPASTTTAWKSVYIFISSTFNDMHAERDYLVKQVLPELREWCEQRKLHLVDIDLRWGVTEQDATLNKRVVQVCLDRIDACRPFFICFLGQRRGWVPKLADISSETLLEFPGLKEYTGNASVTEMEILHSLVQPLRPDKANERSQYSFFYLRDPDYLSQMPAEPAQLRQVYTNEGITDPQERAQSDLELKHWRETKIPALRPVRHYQARWNAQASTPELAYPLSCSSTNPANIEGWQRQWAAAGVPVAGTDLAEIPAAAEKSRAFNHRLTSGRLTDFQINHQPLKDIILQDLKQAIAERYPQNMQPVPNSALQREIDQQEQFIQSAGEGFIPRAGDFDALDAYLQSSSRQLFALSAPGGMGKSTLLANWIQRLKMQPGAARQSIHYRFIGASDGSTSVDNLLASILQEIKATTPKLESELPTNPQELRKALPGLLAEIGREGQTVLVLDALNQLETGLLDLNWLPRLLPAGIKLVVSFKHGEPSGDELAQVWQESQQVTLSQVHPFADLMDRRKLVQAYLSQYLKELDDDLLEILINLPGADNPLYLKIVLSELRVFGVFGKLHEKVRVDFGDNPLAAFQGVLHRLETDPAYTPFDPQQLVPLLFGLLAHTRHGLSAEELACLLMAALKLENNTATQAELQAAVNFVLRQVRPFLARRNSRYDFFYESFKLAALDRYAARVGEAPQPHTKPHQTWHQMLAAYFGSLRLWDSTGQVPNPRKVSELAYHQSYGWMEKELTATLTDLEWLTAKCHAGLTFDLVADFDRVEAGKNRSGLLTVTAWQHGGRYGVRCPACASIFEVPAQNLGQQTECPRCSKLLKLNPFGITLEWQPQLAALRPTSTELPIQLHSETAGEFADLVRREAQFIHHNPGLLEQAARNQPHISSPYRAAQAMQASRTQKKPWLDLVNNDDVPDPCLLFIPGKFYGFGLSPDGARLAAGSGGQMHVWNTYSGQLLLTWKSDLPIHHITGGYINEPVPNCVFSPDGNWILASAYNQARLWKSRSGALLHTFDLPRGAVTCCAFSPDGNRIAIATAMRFLGWDTSDPDGRDRSAIEHSWERKPVDPAACTITLWDAHSGSLLQTLSGHTKGIYACRFSPDGKFIISESGDKTIRIWNERGETVYSMRGLNNDRDRVQSTTLILEGHRLVSHLSGEELDLTTGQPNPDGWAAMKDILSGLTVIGQTNSALSCDEKRAAVVRGGQISIFDLERREVTAIYAPRSETDSADGGITFSPEGTRVISSNPGDGIRVWDAQPGCGSQPVQPGKKYNCYNVAGPWGEREFLVQSFAQTNLEVWDDQSAQRSAGISIKELEAYRPIFMSPGTKIAAWENLNGLRIRDLANETWLFETSSQAQNDSWSPLGITPDQNHVLCHSQKLKQIQLILLINGKASISVNNLPDNILPGHVILSPGGRWLTLPGDADHPALQLWDLTHNRLEATIKPFTQHAFDHFMRAHFTPDGRLLVFVFNDTCTIWDIASRQVIAQHQWPKIKLIVNRSVLSPDGRSVLCGGYKRGICEIDLASGLVLFSVDEPSEILDLSYSPDGKRILYALKNGLIYIHEHATGKRLCSNRIPEPHPRSGIAWNHNASIGAVVAKDSSLSRVKLQDFETADPVATVTRHYHADQKTWANQYALLCPWCKTFHAPDDRLVKMIQEWRKKALKEKGPYFDLPAQAFNDAGLVTTCPKCQGKIRCNPFLSDEK